MRRGFRFNNVFVTNSLCCPSRATYLSGQYSHNHGVHKNSPPDSGVGDFDDGTKGGQTLATVLQRAGYRTAHVGKYLNMYGSEVSNGTAKRAWARLITQVYEVDPLLCPWCGSAMRIIAFIEQPAVIEKILTHLGRWPILAHSPPSSAVAA